MQDSKFVRHFLTKQQQFYELRLKQKCFNETDMAGRLAEVCRRIQDYIYTYCLTILKNLNNE